jgi:ornithine carbamoyltransferase
MTLGMIFEKASMRTRLSFDVGMRQLGGQALYIGKDEIGLGVRESIKDVAKVISRYLDAIMIRVVHHETIEELARFSSIPVINGLSSLYHPCQALSDAFTILEKKGKLSGLKLAFIGDGNNVARSLAAVSLITGMRFSIASPRGYELTADFAKGLRSRSRGCKGSLVMLQDAAKCARDADIIYTDVWASMGQEAERLQRLGHFAAYKVDRKLLSAAKKDALVMHCLPAHRGEEITSDILDGKHSIVYDQAENRMHLQKALLLALMAPDVKVE